MAEAHSSSQDPSLSQSDHVVTLQDYLEEQALLEKQAAEALPGRIDNCTYPIGYIKQAVFVCLTCQEESGELAGVCYSCSISCHTSHDIIELYSRRNFRCDCGNSKFKNISCTLIKDKEKINHQNSYNQDNFRGLYCFCRKQYNAEKDEMTQCLVCENWYHDSCIGSRPSNESYEDFICSSCVCRYSFFHAYKNDPRFMSSTFLPVESEENPEILDVETCQVPNEVFSRQTDECKISSAINTGENKCHLFCRSGWRASMCRCESCKNMYEKEKLNFLIEAEQEYEPEVDDNEETSVHDAGVKALLSMDHNVAVQGVLATNQLAARLKEYLLPFAVEQKTVTKEDILHFFEEEHSKLEESKRRKIFD